MKGNRKRYAGKMNAIYEGKHETNFIKELYMGKKYEFKKGYRNDAIMRQRYNKLIGEAFSLNFENWYQNGYWTDKFNPYSLLDGEEMVSTISVNQMDFEWNGKIRHYIQLGGVTTKESCRKQGLSRFLMTKVLEEYQREADGIYLFANHTVLDFYPKFGFKKAVEWQYFKTVQIEGKRTAKQVPMKEKKDWDVVEQAIKESASNSVIELKHNSELIMFYLTQFMQENVFYIEEQDAYVVAELDGSQLIVQGVYSKNRVVLDEIYRAFGSEIKAVVLGFVPWDKEHYEKRALINEDDTLFVMGEDFNLFSEKQLAFPMLSRA